MATAPVQPLVPVIDRDAAAALLTEQLSDEMRVFGRRGIVIATAMRAGFTRKECHRMLGLLH